MMASVSELIGTQPILALFLAIGLGYAVGQINIFGFSLTGWLFSTSCTVLGATSARQA